MRSHQLKSGKNKSPTWVQHLQSLKERRFITDGLELDDLQRMLRHSNFNTLYYHSVPMVYLLDYTSGRYLNMSASVEQVMGLDQEGFMETGVEFTAYHYHKDHFRLFNEEIFSDRAKFLKRIPPEEQKDYVFSYNHRFQNKRGQYQNLLQRSCFVRSDADGNPLASFGMIINIDYFHQGNRVVHLVERISSDTYGMRADVVDKKVYFVNNEIPRLSDREREVLLWMAEGFTSKQIAHKLHVSEHTVINHSRNMQEKFGMLNAVALVAYAIRNGLI